jgi:hypothetical protein
MTTVSARLLSSSSFVTAIRLGGGTDEFTAAALLLETQRKDLRGRADRAI